MVKPGEKRPVSRQKSIVDLFQKPAKTTRGISDRSKTPSSAVGQNNELSPSLPGENIELSPSLPGENIELSPSLPGEITNCRRRLWSVKTTNCLRRCPAKTSNYLRRCPAKITNCRRRLWSLNITDLLVHWLSVKPNILHIKPQSDTKLPKASTLTNWRQTYEWLEITGRNTMICKICVSQKEQIILKIRHHPWDSFTERQISKALP